jgi:hypothetical protein
MPFLGEMHLGDTVWMDSNGDGVQDPDEKGVEGVTVTLLDENGAVVETTKTDADGHYEFAIKKPGKYKVKFDEAHHYTQKGKGTPETDSNVAGSNGTTDLIEMNWGDTDMSIDAGITPTAHIGDYFWIDENKDGIQGPDEKPVHGKGALVELLDKDGNKLYWTSPDHVNLTTQKTEWPAEVHPDKNGKYGFDVPPNKKYLVRFTISDKLRNDGYVFTGRNAGNAGLDSDVGNNGVITVPVDAKAGGNYPTLDAGINCGCSEVHSDSTDSMSKLTLAMMAMMILGLALMMGRKEEEA